MSNYTTIATVDGFLIGYLNDEDEYQIMHTLTTCVFYLNCDFVLIAEKCFARPLPEFLNKIVTTIINAKKVTKK